MENADQRRKQLVQCLNRSYGATGWTESASVVTGADCTNQFVVVVAIRANDAWLSRVGTGGSLASAFCDACSLFGGFIDCEGSASGEAKVAESLAPAHGSESSAQQPDLPQSPPGHKAAPLKVEAERKGAEVRRRGHSPDSNPLWVLASYQSVDGSVVTISHEVVRKTGCVLMSDGCGTRPKAYREECLRVYAGKLRAAEFAATFEKVCQAQVEAIIEICVENALTAEDVVEELNRLF
jgi:hypothetical protein